MSIEFTPQGITVDDFNTIFKKKQEEYLELYGSNLNLDQDTPNGQRIGIESNVILDLQSYGGYLYTQIDPDFAEGENLNTLAKISGTFRKPATRSTCVVNVTISKPVNIPLGWEVKDTNGNTWKTIRQYQLSITGEAGNNITLYAEDFGAIVADTNTLTNQTIVIDGITSVTNELVADVGLEEETDEVLRIRRHLSTENAANSTIGSLTASLLALEGVKEAVVYENNTNNLIGDTLRDSDTGFPAHSIWVIIDGGDINEIAKTIVTSKTAGCAERGETQPYKETIQGGRVITHNPAFDRPTLVGVTVQVTATPTDSAQSVDNDVIAKALQARTFGIGENMEVTSLYGDIYPAYPGNISISGLTANRGASDESGQIESERNEILVIDTIFVGPTDGTRVLVLSPPIGIDDQSLTAVVEEDAATGFVVGTVVFTGTPEVFEILSGNNEGDFAIDNTGQITVAKDLDYETTPIYKLRVKISKLGTEDKTATITIRITNVDENIIEFNPLTQTRRAAGDAVIGENVGVPLTVSGNTPVLFFKIKDGDGRGKFRIDNSGQITVDTKLNFATTPTYTLDVEITGADALMKRSEITINVVEPITLKNGQTTVGEHTPLGLPIGDAPGNTGNPTGYSITAGDDDNNFAIDNRGGLVIAKALDFETTPIYYLTITATKDGTNDATAIYTVNVTDANIAIANDSFTIEAGNAVNDEIGKIVITGDTAKSFRITRGNTGTRFAIDNDGYITALKVLTVGKTILTVRVTGDGSDTITAPITITVTAKET